MGKSPLVRIMSAAIFFQLVQIIGKRKVTLNLAHLRETREAVITHEIELSRKLVNLGRVEDHARQLEYQSFYEKH